MNRMYSKKFWATMFVLAVISLGLFTRHISELIFQQLIMFLVPIYWGMDIADKKMNQVDNSVDNNIDKEIVNIIDKKEEA